MKSVAWMWWVQHHQGIDEPLGGEGITHGDPIRGKGPKIPDPGIEGPDWPPLGGKGKLPGAGIK
jgi:hypothetical protein